MRKLKIGDVVTYTLFDNEELHTGVVNGIEICREGMKYGRFVRSCDLDKHKNGIVCMPMHWCYFDQVKSIKSRKS